MTVLYGERRLALLFALLGCAALIFALTHERAGRRPLPVTAFYINPSASTASPCGPAGSLMCRPGSDKNNCESIDNPCQTLQYAIIFTATAYDFGNAHVMFFLAHGKFDECVLLPPYVYTGPSDKQVEISGDSTDASASVVNCALPGNNAITSVNAPQGWLLEYFQLEATNLCTQADYHGVIYLRAMYLGTCTVGAVADGPSAFIEFVKDPLSDAPTKIVGTEAAWLSVIANAEIAFQSTPIVVKDGLDFKVAFALTSLGGVIDLSQAGKISGEHVTGTKFIVGQSVDSSSGGAPGAIYCGGGLDCNKVLLGDKPGSAQQR